MGHEELMTAAVKERVVGECEGWLRAGLSTEPCDRAGAEAAVVARYRAHGLSAPETVVWMDSPLGGALASWVLRHGFEHRLDGRLFTDADAGPPRQLAPEFAERVERRLREQLPTRAGGTRGPCWPGRSATPSSTRRKRWSRRSAHPCETCSAWRGTRGSPAPTS